MDFTYYDDSDYFDDEMNPSSADPTTIDFPLKRAVFVGSEELQACIGLHGTSDLQAGPSTKWTGNHRFSNCWTTNWPSL